MSQKMPASSPELGVVLSNDPVDPVVLSSVCTNVERNPLLSGTQAIYIEGIPIFFRIVIICLYLFISNLLIMLCVPDSYKVSYFGNRVSFYCFCSVCPFTFLSSNVTLLFMSFKDFNYYSVISMTTY